MSYIKIAKIVKETVDIPEKGYIYFGYDTGGLWIKDDDGTAAYYILTGQGGSVPVISYISPTSDVVGSTINIIGNNFIQGATTVTFSGVEGLSVTVLSVTSLTVVVPSISAGLASVIVTTSYGSSNPGSFTVSVPNTKPIISSISPSPTTVESKVNVNGYNFIVGGTTLYFGPYSGETECVATTSLTSVVPVIPNGTYDVTAQTTTPDSSNTVSLVIGTSVIPNITSFSPTSGYTGTTISLVGTNFLTGQTQVFFGTTPASNITTLSTTNLTAVIAFGTQIGKTSIIVANELGSNSMSGFTVLGSTGGSLPTIVSILPLNQPAGSIVTISGNNFNVNGTPLVTFGNAAAIVSSVSATTCIVTISGNTLPGPLTVTLNNGYGSATFTYTVYSPPSGPYIESFTPDNGSIGDIITISGNNFVVGSGNAIFFGAPTAVSQLVSGMTTTLLTAKIPTYSASGYVKIQNTYGQYSKNGFTINALGGNDPTISSVGPYDHYTQTGQVLQVHGTNFTPNDTSISFGTTYPGTQFPTQCTSSVYATATVPSDFVDSGQFVTGFVYLTTPSGSCSLAGSFDIYKPPLNGLQAPIITSFTPTSGNAGTEITINGNHFCKYWTNPSGVVMVYMAGKTPPGIYPAYIPLENYQWISYNQIKGTVPTNPWGYTGAASVYVSNQAGSATKTGFTII